MNRQPILHFDGFSVAFGEKTILADVDLTVEDRGVTLLLGPSGSGKSTLLRTVAGFNDAHPSLVTWGEARFLGAPLSEHPIPAPGTPRAQIGFVRQHARFFLDTVRENIASALPNRATLDYSLQTDIIIELLCTHGLEALVPRLAEPVANLTPPVQRKLAVVRTLASAPALLLADEPTTGLPESDAIELLELLQAEAERRAVVLIIHNQRLARRVGTTAVLLSGGRVREVAPSEQFFTAPKTPSGLSYVTTGNCPDFSPSASAEELIPDGEEVAPTPAPVPPPTPKPIGPADAPRGFFWLLPQKLGGFPRPGIGMRSAEQDLDGIAALGVTHVVTLEEEKTIPEEELTQRGIALIHFPIVDMQVPTCAAALALCKQVEELLQIGGVVVMHCKGGLGRTGTMLALYLVYQGHPGSEALERARSINPRWIQSEVQVEFLSHFERYLKEQETL